MQFSFFLTTDETCDLLRCKPDALKGLRKDWIEGVHYIRRGKGPTAPILYVQDMIIDWLINQKAPETHQAGIENFRRSLVSGQTRYSWPKLKR